MQIDDGQVLELCRKIAVAGERGRSRRFPQALRSEIANFVVQARASGLSGADVCRRLDVPWESVARWISAGAAAERPRGRLRPVVVKPEPVSAGCLVLRTEQFTVEGLDVAGLVALLRQLR